MCSQPALTISSQPLTHWSPRTQRANCHSSSSLYGVEFSLTYVTLFSSTSFQNVCYLTLRFLIFRTTTNCIETSRGKQDPRFFSPTGRMKIYVLLRITNQIFKFQIEVVLVQWCIELSCEGNRAPLCKTIFRLSRHKLHLKILTVTLVWCCWWCF